MTGRKKAKSQPAGNTEAIDQAARELIEASSTDDPAGRFSAILLAHGLNGLDLLDSIVRIKSTAAINFLYRLLPVAGDKVLVKGIKKAIYRLEQQGLTPEADLKPGGQAVIRVRTERHPAGYLSEYDRSMSRMGVLAFPDQPVGWKVATFLINQAQGLTEFNFLQLSQGELHRMVSQMKDDLPELFEVPPEVARFALAEAAELSRGLGWSPTEEYQSYLITAAGLPVRNQPAIYDCLSAEEINLEVNLETRAPDLMNHPLMDGLTLGEELEPYFEQLEEIKTSVLVLTTAQEQERRQAIIEKADREIFNTQRRAVLKRQLEETAFLFWQIEEKELAKVCLAAALDLDREAGPIAPYVITREIVWESYYALEEILTELKSTGQVSNTILLPRTGPATKNLPEVDL